MAFIGGSATVAISQNPYAKAYSGADILTIISTDHSYLNISHIYKYSNMILDPRNVYKFSSKKVIPC